MVVLRYLVWFAFTCLAWLRYRVRVKGWEKLEGQTGPFLIAPNHPAYIDPLLINLTFWPTFKARPMLFEGMFQSWFMRFLMYILNAIRVPDTEQLSSDTRQRAQRAIEESVEVLKGGENLLMWPAGHVQRDGLEHLGSASALTEILEGVEKVTVLRVRTRGLYGSSLSYAYTGSAPSLGDRAWAAVGWLVASLLFFMPRRNVEMTLDVVTKDDLPQLERDKINSAFEEWYNASGAEKPSFVPYHLFLGPREYEFPPAAEMEEVDASDVQPETKQAVNEILFDKLKQMGAESTDTDLQADTKLEQLGLDSLTRMDVSLEVERRFGFSAEGVPVTVGQLWVLAAGQAKKEPPKPPPEAWFQRSSDDPIGFLGETIPQAFVERALQSRKEVAVADDMAGVLNYERLLVGVLTLSRRFAKLSGTNVGVLLPASVGSDLALLGLQLIGKTPVVLNWTTGQSNLRHAVNITSMKYVVTSKVFVERISLRIEGVEFAYLEDLRQDIGKLELLWTLFKVRWLPGSVRKCVPNTNPEQTAAVLFTSGSEKAPKAVPLTHKNLLSNQRMAVEMLGVTRRDSLLGFLPAFHSFGLTVTGLLPLVTGLRVVRHPDPTDAGGLARKIGMYKPTLVAGTPTFMRYIVNHAEKGEMESLRLIVVGAEKCPDELFERIAELAPNAKLLEGYGITECSPVVSVNPPEDIRPGTIGKPLPGVEVKVVDLDSDEEKPTDEMGMLLIHGPTIFPGYIGYDGPSPFAERDGKRWYVTGDLAKIDADGFLYFSGRLKRFLKAGGEMISLPALEEPFAQKYPPDEDGPRVAVEGVELDDGRHVVLFTKEPISLSEANQILAGEGFHGVMRLTDVQQVDEIPVLGTGKTDYKVLRKRICSA